MFEEIKRAINESGIDMPEMSNVNRAIDTLENTVSIAKTALAARIMNMVQQGDVEQLYKLRGLVEVFNAGETASNTVTLASNLKNHRPKAVKFNNESEDITTWRGVSEAILKMLYKESPKNFASLLHSTDIDKEKPYFAKSPENMTAPLMLGSGKDVVYADVSRVTNNDFFFLKKTLSALGHSIDEVMVELDPEFNRKKIERRKTKEVKNEKSKKSPGRKKKDVAAEAAPVEVTVS